MPELRVRAGHQHEGQAVSRRQPLRAGRDRGDLQRVFSRRLGFRPPARGDRTAQARQGDVVVDDRHRHAEAHQHVVGPEERHQRIASIGGFAAKHRVRDGQRPRLRELRVRSKHRKRERHDSGPRADLSAEAVEFVTHPRLVKQAGGIFHFRRTGELLAVHAFAESLRLVEQRAHVGAGEGLVSAPVVGVDLPESFTRGLARGRGDLLHAGLVESHGLADELGRRLVGPAVDREHHVLNLATELRGLQGVTRVAGDHGLERPDRHVPRGLRAVGLAGLCEPRLRRFHLPTRLRLDSLVEIRVAVEWGFHRREGRANRLAGVERRVYAPVGVIRHLGSPVCRAQGHQLAP